MILVDTRAALEGACQELAGATTVYLDTEFESSQRGTQLCLIQISRGEKIWLIDAVRLAAVEPLAQALGAPDQQWVLHAGQQDVRLLLSRLRMERPPRLFDTQIAWALLGPEHSVSLAYLQYRLLGLRSSKPHQADDWLRRPMSDSQLEYAASDVAHLPALHRELLLRAHAHERETIIERLTAVRGIGRWTAEMLLIFRLGRPDVLPVDDYGVRKGFALAFKKKELPGRKDLEKRGARWQPYRSVATWYLWRALDPAPDA